MRKIFKNNAGFTLIETVLTLGIFLIVLLALLLLYGNYSQTYGTQQAASRAGMMASATASELEDQLLQADQILGSHTFSGVTYNSGQNTLVLEMPSIDSGGKAIVGKSDYAVFYVSGSRLFRKLETDASSSRKASLKLLSDCLASITFTYNNADVAQATKVDVDILNQITGYHQTVKYPLHQTIYMRNY